MPTIAAATTIQLSTATPDEEAKVKKERPSLKKFHLSSITNSCIVNALKQHLNTWRQKLISSKGSKSRNKGKAEQQHHKIQQVQPPRQEKPNHYLQKGNNHDNLHGKWLRRISRKELIKSNINTSNSLLQNTRRVYCKTKIQEFYSTTSYRSPCPTSATIVGDHKGPRCHRYGRKIEIIAKLLSLDLIRPGNKAKSCLIKDNKSKSRDSLDSGCFSISTISLESESFEKTKDLNLTSQAHSSTALKLTAVDKMTITASDFLGIRDEYPDLDSEIRSILTARAQDGTTISEIKDDYRKLTGLSFPIYDGITDFLLSIPYVSAYCNEHGTRIFNIRPTDKTKHIHDMVLSQKQSQESSMQISNKSNYRSYFRERQRNPNYYPSNWRSNSRYRYSKMSEKTANNIQYPPQQQQQQQQVVVQRQPSLRTKALTMETEKTTRPVTACSDENGRLEDTTAFNEHNCCYNDNCNYILNRICNNQDILDPIVNPISLQAIEPPPIMYAWDDQDQQQQQQQQQLDSMTHKDPLNAATELNKFISEPTCYDNNINHLNSLFHKATNQKNKRSMNGSVKGYMPSAPPPPPPGSSRSPTIRSYSTNDSMFTDSDYEAHLLDFLLLGDDFLLFMARMELRCKFKKNQRVLQSGLCVSGQTINAAIKRISSVNNAAGRSIIVNIGSVNILQCRQLIQIEHEYRELIKTMIKKGIKPILTTLAPLANYTHNDEVKITLERYNEFIKREGKRLDLVVIDIWKCLVNAKGHVLFDCYQSEPRVVTGAKESYLFWNKIGRQRVLQLIESHLEY